MEENGLISAIFEAIPEEETVFVMDSCEKAAEAIYKYSNSAYGLIDYVINQKAALDLNLNGFMDTLQDSETKDLINGLITKLN